MMRSALGPLMALAALTMVVAAPALAQVTSPQEIFSKANSLYAEEDYEEALRLYRQVIDAGWEAPELYYNTSNCYLRTGRPGYALVMCRRAARLAPNDDDIKANLAFIESVVHERASEPEGALLLDLLLAPHRSLSIDWVLVIVSASAFALAALLSFRVLSEGHRRIVGYLTAAVALVLAVSLADFGAKLWRDLERAEAIIVVPVAKVRSGPGEDFVVQTSLGEGAEVTVRRYGERWTEVSLEGDLAGWIKSTDLEVI